jgi:hypothetical protein
MLQWNLPGKADENYETLQWEHLVFRQTFEPESPQTSHKRYRLNQRDRIIECKSRDTHVVWVAHIKGEQINNKHNSLQKH